MKLRIKKPRQIIKDESPVKRPYAIKRPRNLSKDELTLIHTYVEAYSNMLGEPESDMRDACLNHFEARINSIPTSGNKVLPLLRAVKRWTKANEPGYYSVDWPYEEYSCMFGVCELLLRRRVTFSAEALNFLAPFIGAAYLSIPFEGWHQPDLRFLGIGGFVNRLNTAEVAQRKPKDTAIPEKWKKWIANHKTKPRKRSTNS